MKKVTLLIPVYNEEAMLPTLYQRLIELINRNGTYAWEILFINDGSSDRTLDVIRQLRQTDSRVNFVNLSRNFGKEIAMLAGFDYTTGDCCVVMDADLQDPPELVDRMLQYWEEGYDDIYAKRRNRGEESWMRRRLSLAFYSILQKMSRIDILPNVGDFRLLDRRCVLTLRHLREQERYTKRTILLDRLPEEKHRIRPGRPPCRTLLMEFLQTAEPGNRRNHLLFHRSPAHCHRLRYPLFHFQLYLRYLFPDKDHHIRRPGRRFPHPDSRYSILGRHPTVLIGCYRRVYRTYFQRDQKTPCLYRIGLQ